jgi:FkbM family methyltransferase
MFEIMRRVLARRSNCIDAGSFHGSHLSVMAKYAPDGDLYGFEPLPHLCRELRGMFPGRRAHIACTALSDRRGEAEFQFVVSNPGYSSFYRRRLYPEQRPEIRVIEVPTRTLDEMVPATRRIDFVKIDVEGAELLVLKGGRRTLRAWRPFILFEHGLEGPGYDPEALELHRRIVQDFGLRVTSMARWLGGAPDMTEAEFLDTVFRHRDWNFLAHP